MSKPSHAIVVGASIAGLAAARVLSDHFDQVTLLERDQVSTETSFRKGVPQARHVHALLIGGQRALEGMLPGLTDAVIAAGGVTPNMGRDVAWYLFGGFRPRYSSELSPLCSSRPLLEAEVRRKVLAIPNITLREGMEIDGFFTDAARKTVKGVHYHEVRDDGPVLTMDASLVVDATGRGSRTPAMLEALGYTRPEEVTVTSNAAYATRMYRAPVHNKRPWCFLYVQPGPPSGTRGGVLVPLEGGRWHVTLIGMAGDRPPVDEAGFLAFAKSLPVPDLYEAILDAEPIGGISSFAKAENRLRRYDQLPRYLEGLVALGDAVYALNPVYGQGMTAAALGAQALDKTLRAQTSTKGLEIGGLARRFQKALSKVISGPWSMSTGEDLRWPSPENEGRISFGTRMIQAYVDRVQRASLHSPVACEAFYRVSQMIDAPTTLFKPAILWVALGGGGSRPAPKLIPQVGV